MKGDHTTTMTPASNPTWGGPRKPAPGKRIGRPRAYAGTARRVYFFLSDEEIAGLDHLAQREGTTRTAVMRRLIGEALSQENPNAGAEGQIRALATVLLDEFGGPVEGDGGAGDMAIRVLREQRGEIETLRRQLAWHEDAPTRRPDAT